jgi:hypothetical protein
MATHLKLAYGIREGNLVHIAQVPNGLSCGCTCPGCGAQLVARNQGKKKVAHFAHHQAPECAHGLQTALHLAAKDIISRHQTFCLPGAVGEFSFTQAYWRTFSFDAAHYQSCIPGDVGVPSEYNIPSRYVTVNEVRLERKSEDIIPDIVLITPAGQILVEVAVTHFIDELKLAKIKRLGIPCIEIDLSKLPRDFDLPQLEQLLIHGIEEKRWKYNAKLREKLTAMRQQYFEAARPFFLEAHIEETTTRSRQPSYEWYRAKKMRDRAALQAEQQALQAQNQLRREEQARQEAIFFATKLRPVVIRTFESGSSKPPIKRKHVPTCPLEPRLYDGQPYASMEADCARCSYFKGYQEHEQAVVCLLQATVQ